MRGYRDRDFLQTNEGFFFCVIGQLHPLDRVISYIKYVPSESGEWGRGEKKFNRVLKNYTIPNLLETFNYLKWNYPNYMFHSPSDNVTLTAVPLENIEKHFKPEQKLAQLKQTHKLDSLQDKLVRLTGFLEEASGISEGSFGVTGSILLDIHKCTFSDLDIIIYGIKESWTLKKTLTEYRESEIPLKHLKGKSLQKWGLKKAEQYPLTAKEAIKLYERKWNLGFFEDRWVSIHPVKLENEVTTEYGKRKYTSYGQVTIEAVVRRNVNSIFLPATYQIEDVKFLDGQQLGPVTELVSYEGLYSSLAKNGEKIQAKGKLEKVSENGTGTQYYRVLVGSAEGKGKEYIKLFE
jgi:predicted nucleotidyltransferase